MTNQTVAVSMALFKKGYYLPFIQYVTVTSLHFCYPIVNGNVNAKIMRHYALANLTFKVSTSNAKNS